MALAIDVSSPARATAGPTGTITTASFDPPASVLIACVGGDHNTVTMSNNGAALTWSEIATRNSVDSGGNGGVATAWSAPLSAGRTGMTVTATLSATQEITIRLYVVTGADPVTPVGGSAEGSSALTSVTTTGFTTTGASSLGFVVANDFNNTGSPTSSDTTADPYTMGAGGDSGLSGYKTLGSAGSSATFQFSAAAGTPAWNWVAFEVKAAAPSGPQLWIPIRPIQVP